MTVITKTNMCCSGVICRNFRRASPSRTSLLLCLLFLSLSQMLPKYSRAVFTQPTNLTPKALRNNRQNFSGFCGRHPAGLHTWSTQKKYLQIPLHSPVCQIPTAAAKTFLPMAITLCFSLSSSPSFCQSLSVLFRVKPATLFQSAPMYPAPRSTSSPPRRRSKGEASGCGMKM